MCDAGSAGQGAQSVQFTEQSDRDYVKIAGQVEALSRHSICQGGGGEITGGPCPVPWW